MTESASTYQISNPEEKLVATDDLRIVRNPAPIRAQVLESLRQAILDRRFTPGQRLIERELVEQTGVSRTSIREALRELAAEGLVTTVPNRGTVVSSVSAKDARELYQVRTVLEGLAARLFVENATESQRKDLVKALKRVEKAVEAGQSSLEPKDALYAVLFEGAGNDVLRSMAGTLHARVAVIRALSLTLPGRPAASAQELREMVDAVLADDAEAAARAFSHHIEQAGRSGLAALYADQQVFPNASSRSGE